MRVCIGCVAMLLSAMGVVTDAVAVSENNADVAGKRGLSPVITQATQAGQGDANTERTIGVCHPLSNPAQPQIPGATTSAENSLSPVLSVKNYFYSVENLTVEGKSSVIVLAGPKHGRLEDIGTTVYDENGSPIRDTGERNYLYIPEPDYLGNDSATLLVEIGGYKVKMVYSFRVETVVNDFYELCPKPFWRISANVDGNGIITAIEYQSPAVGKKGDGSIYF